MPAFMKLDGIQGEASDSVHPGWIIIQSLSSPIYRAIPSGARDQQRTKGETKLGDIIVVRELDKSSVPIQQACANGTFYQSVEIHLCTTVKNRQEPYLIYKLSDVIITSYSFHGNSSGDPLPTEQLTLGYAKVEWTYVTLDPKTGDARGKVPGSYNPGQGRA